MNVHVMRSDLKRYRKHGFAVKDSHFEVTGNAQSGYNLWLVSFANRATRQLVTTFSTLDDLAAYVEAES